MKKLLITSLLFFMIISISVIANADMEAPMIKRYVAKVNEINGVDLKDYDGTVIVHLDYGDEVEVYYEYSDTDTNEVYAGCNYTVKDGEPYINNKKRVSGEISLKSLSVDDNEYVSELLNIEEPIIGYVFAREGIEIHKGPSEIYDKIGTTIPYGTKLTLYKEKDENQDIIPWFYVKYNGVSGWIDETYMKLVYEIDLDYVVAMPNIEFEVYNEKTKKFELETTIPGNTVLLNPLEFDPWSQAYLVTYNGTVGKINNRDVAYEHPHNVEVMTDKETKIYSIPDLNEGKVLGTIPESIVLVYKFDGNYINWKYIEYNGIKGWIDGENIDFLQSKVEGEVAEFDKTIGHKNLAYDDFIIDIKDDENKSVDNKVLNEVIEEEVYVSVDLDPKTTPNQIIVAGVVTAVIISLTCIVSIILINKTSKVEEKDDENK